jgi:hypothetical protein
MDSDVSLFPSEELAIEKVGQPAFTGVSTGERLLAQRPELYRIAVQLLGQGTGIREIKRLTGLHHRTIEAVMLREGATIDTHRKELGARALKVAALGVELLEEKISAGDIKAGELSMAIGILVDKGQVLTGGVTARVEKIEQAQVAAGLERILDELPVIDAEIVPGINSGSENLDPIAAGRSLPSDGQSDASAASDSVAPETATPKATSKASKPTRKNPAAGSKVKAAKEGGRGFDRAAGSETATDQLSENFIAMPISQEGLDPSSETTERSKK